MYVGGIPDIASGYSNTYPTSAGAFGFNLISSPTGMSGTDVLQLNFTSFQVSYLKFGAVSIVAGGGESSVYSQNLGPGLQIDTSKPVSFSLTSASLSNVSVDPVSGRVKSFEAFGTGDIYGSLVPEPATMVSLAGMALSGLAYALWHRLRAA
jgi:hypothetical protein